MRALNAVPDGRSDTVTAATTLPAFPPAELNTTEAVELITTRIYAAVNTLRTVHDDIDAAAPSTARPGARDRRRVGEGRMDAQVRESQDLALITGARDEQH